MPTLDMSGSNKLGNALHLEINNAVKDYKHSLLPDELLITQNQLTSLSGSVEEMMDSGELGFLTPDNFMEVRVKDV